MPGWVFCYCSSSPVQQFFYSFFRSAFGRLTRPPPPNNFRYLRRGCFFCRAFEQFKEAINDEDLEDSFLKKVLPFLNISGRQVPCEHSQVGDDYGPARVRGSGGGDGGGSGGGSDCAFLRTLRGGTPASRMSATLT